MGTSMGKVKGDVLEYRLHADCMHIKGGEPFESSRSVLIGMNFARKGDRLVTW